MQAKVTHKVANVYDAVALEDNRVFYAPKLGTWATAWQLAKFQSPVTELSESEQYSVDVPDEVVAEAHAAVEEFLSAYSDV